MYQKRLYKTRFEIPAIVLYSILFIVPVILNFAYSLTNWNAIKLTGETAKFVGLKNFKTIFSDPELVMIIVRTVWYAFVTTIFKNILGFLLALALDKGLKSKQALRAIFFLPSMLSPLIIGLMFGSLLMTSGFFNQLLEGVGLGSLARPWLTSPETALGGAMVVDIWKQVGFNMVIYLAGLQLIDSSFYEAASIDGASAFQQLIYITIPRMTPSFIINLLLNMSAGLKTFDIIFVLTGGGPNGRTELINTMVFKQYGQKLYGMSAAYGVIVFLITAVFGLLILSIKDDRDS
ncbi:MAG: sugar ABC transporter permease [Oscillospiraceae bacterium]|nr:sugar ABC transporter permease [Oscillospiraceae bacterium]